MLVRRTLNTPPQETGGLTEAPRTGGQASIYQQDQQIRSKKQRTPKIRRFKQQLFNLSPSQTNIGRVRKNQDISHGRYIASKAEEGSPGEVWSGIIKKKNYGELAEYFQRQAWNSPEALKRSDFEKFRYYHYMELWQAKKNREEQEVARIRELSGSTQNQDEAHRESRMHAANREAHDLWLQSRRKQFLKAGACTAAQEVVLRARAGSDVCQS